MSDFTQDAEVVGTFVRERECKHSVRYKAKDEHSAELATLIYISKSALTILNEPKEITVTLTVV